MNASSPRYWYTVGHIVTFDVAGLTHDGVA
jgi:hypothetical protein